MSGNTGLNVIVVLFALTLSISPASADEKKTAESKSSVGSAAIVDPIKIESGLISGKTIGEAGKELRAYLGIPCSKKPGNSCWVSGPGKLALLT